MVRVKNPLSLQQQNSFENVNSSSQIPKSKSPKKTTLNTKKIPPTSSKRSPLPKKPHSIDGNSDVIVATLFTPPRILDVIA